MKLGRLAVALTCLVTPLAQADVVFSGYIGFDVTGSDESESVDEEGEVIPSGSPTLTGDSTSLNVAVRHTTEGGFTAYGNYRLDASLSGSGLIGENIWIVFDRSSVDHAKVRMLSSELLDDLRKSARIVVHSNRFSDRHQISISKQVRC